MSSKGERERRRRAYLDRERAKAAAQKRAGVEADPKKPVQAKAAQQRHKSGLEWLRERKRLTPVQFQAGQRYGQIFRGSLLEHGVSLKSCINDEVGGGDGGFPLTGETEAWIADCKLSLARARAALSGHEGMVAACDVICGRGLTCREVSPVKEEAAQIEDTLRIALDLLAEHFWPQRKVA